MTMQPESISSLDLNSINIQRKIKGFGLNFNYKLKKLLYPQHFYNKYYMVGCY